MRILFLFFILSILTFDTYSQSADSIIVLQSPAGRLSGLIDIQDLGNDGFNYWDDEFKGHWSGIEIGFNGFANSDYSMYPIENNNFLKNDLLRSNTLNLNLLQYSMGLQQTRTTIGIVTGIGLNFQSYRLDDNTSILLDDDHKVQPVKLFYDANQKSKLSSVYLEVPLLVEFQVPIRNRANRMYFSAGITGAKRLETHTKVKYRNGRKKEKLKSTGAFAIDDYKAAATVRFGYRWVNLFASYDIVPLFEERKGPVLYPFTIGLRLISF